MAIPNVSETFLDGGLGLVPGESGRTMLTIGVSSTGTANTLYASGTTDQLTSSLGRGPLVEAGMLKLNEPNHGDQLFMPVTASVAGTNGAVTAPATGTPPVMTVTGTPNDSYDVKVKMTLGGAVGAALFQYSTDGGDTYSSDVTTAATFAVPNTGVTLNFAAGTYVAADVYTFSSTGPYYSAANLSTAITAALAGYNSNPFGIIHIVGAPADATGLATVFSTVESLMVTAQSQHKFIRAVIEAPDVSDALLKTAFASLSSANGRTSVVVGYVELVSPTGGGIQKRPAAWPYMARVAAIPLSQDAAWIGAGKLNSVSSLLRDEDTIGGMDTARFVTLRTIQGRIGAFVTNPNTMALTTSDYRYLQHGRVMDRLAEVVRNAMLYYLNGNTRVDKTTGRILEQDAAAIDADVLGQAKAALLDEQHVSDIIVVVNRTDNVLSTGKLRISAKAVPLNYPKQIAIELGFSNPALTPAA